MKLSRTHTMPGGLDDLALKYKEILRTMYSINWNFQVVTNSVHAHNFTCFEEVNGPCGTVVIKSA